jgi:hypothetical protein
MRHAHRVLVGKLKERDQQGEMGASGRIMLKCEAVIWIHLAQDRVVANPCGHDY